MNKKNFEKKTTWRNWLIRKLLSNENSKEDILSFIKNDNETNLDSDNFSIDENNEETGCPLVLPGSHKRSFNFEGRYHLLDMPGSVPVILHPGDVLLFSEATMHAGLPRKAPGSRKNLYINYIDGETGVTNADGNLHHYWVPPEARARFPEEKQSLFEWMKTSVGA